MELERQTKEKNAGNISSQMTASVFPALQLSPVPVVGVGRRCHGPDRR